MKIGGTYITFKRRLDRKLCGIYYLWDGAAVIYIGASIDIERRIGEHFSNGIDFSGYFADECDAKELRSREIAAIREFKPILNEIYREREPGVFRGEWPAKSGGRPSRRWLDATPTTPPVPTNRNPALVG